MGSKFKYDLSKKSGNQEFYSISDLQFGANFCLPELMSWLPLQSPNRRIERVNYVQTYVLETETYSNHQYNDGKLVQFDLLPHGAETNIVKNTWNCSK